MNIRTQKYNVAGHDFSISMPQETPLWNMLSNYGPFLKENNCCDTSSSEAEIFSLKVSVIANISELPFSMEDIVKSTDIDNDITFIRHLLLNSGHSVFILSISKENLGDAGFLVMSPHSPSVDLYIPDGSTDNLPLLKHNIFVINNSLMLLFAYFTATRSTLLIHASVAVNGRYAQVFLGRSGTGKSTHTRLWLENIPGTWLLNDDNPALRIMPDGNVLAFGTPWSGKTPCYKNSSAILHGIVRLSQAPHNCISRLTGIRAYAALSPSASAVKWEKYSADGIHSTITDIITKVPVFHLECLPDSDAAQLCHDTLYNPQ
ncbi:MAG: hypothetical protein SOX26_05470 [Phocaeicola sp.]|nr:hypothetical protein [Phocaeicola sp.]